MFDLFKIFFLLGWVSFGGPAAHIGYFRTAFVEKRQWLTESEYAQLIALSQFLPGPGSSQIGFSIGYQRGGLLGGIAAFLGFTTPSIALMIAIAAFSQQWLDNTWIQGVIHGLKLLAVVVVFDATYTMFKQFCQHKRHQALCVFTTCVCLLWPSAISQIICLVIAAGIGYFYNATSIPNTVTKHPASNTSTANSINLSLSEKLALTLFVGLFLFSISWPTTNMLTSMLQDFFSAGSLVFGGGHVVLPLLQSTVGSQLSNDTFMAGYAAAQAMPGPMFTFATYLGYVLLPNMPIIGALLATLMIFLPGFLLIIGLLKQWQNFSQRSHVLPMVAGVNAAVVGLLMAALYQPIFVSAVGHSLDMLVVVSGIFVLRSIKVPIIALVTSFATVGCGISVFTY
ncbi:chromate efflux transporter [Vibrio algivorus]|uniref:Chorismate-binding protein n=1 Tax=Vibrio algivorus TaxID=1667024 RepID=A0ABQ6EPF9_9VIBR|nr:chromate efflux transporter [Vibrio algivorus]GLT14864.1 chorismate-binding protein [Vibrio algivorus]